VGAGAAPDHGRVSVIELEDVGRSYETGGGTVRALAGVDLDIAGGEFVVVLGPSGSGKTTLLNVIGALDVPTSGRAVVAGHDLSRAHGGSCSGTGGRR
jgi:putative ABC transport system ATP-binding protein